VLNVEARELGAALNQRDPLDSPTAQHHVTAAPQLDRVETFN
jgi:hypothetical protein